MKIVEVNRRGKILCVKLTVIPCVVHIVVCCRIFDHEDTDADNIVYINWLNMVRAGLLGLEFFTPENKKWRQVSL